MIKILAARRTQLDRTLSQSPALKIHLTSSPIDNSRARHSNWTKTQIIFDIYCTQFGVWRAIVIYCSVRVHTTFIVTKFWKKSIDICNRIIREIVLFAYFQSLLKVNKHDKYIKTVVYFSPCTRTSKLTLKTNFFLPHRYCKITTCTIQFKIPKAINIAARYKQSIL